MSIKFEAILENYGFDSSATPEWLMIPLEDHKPIWLVDGAGLTVTSTAPGIASVVVEDKTAPALPTWRVLTIRGNMAGRTFIEVRRGRELVKRLEVSVKPPITLKISFHFVSDEAGNTTKRTPQELDEMMFWLNQIYTPQTNITFQKNNYQPLKISKNFGTAVNHRTDIYGKPLEGHEWGLGCVEARQ